MLYIIFKIVKQQENRYKRHLFLTDIYCFTLQAYRESLKIKYDVILYLTSFADANF